jgi:hypothetical protein
MTIEMIHTNNLTQRIAEAKKMRSEAEAARDEANKERLLLQIERTEGTGKGSGGAAPAGMQAFFEFMELIKSPEEYEKKAEALLKLSSDAEKYVKAHGGLRKAATANAKADELLAKVNDEQRLAAELLSDAKAEAARIKESAEEDMADEKARLHDLTRQNEIRSRELDAALKEAGRAKRDAEDGLKKAERERDKLVGERALVGTEQARLKAISDSIGPI